MRTVTHARTRGTPRRRAHPHAARHARIRDAFNKYGLATDSQQKVEADERHQYAVTDPPHPRAAAVDDPIPRVTQLKEQRHTRGVVARRCAPLSRASVQHKLKFAARGAGG